MTGSGPDLAWVNKRHIYSFLLGRRNGFVSAQLKRNGRAVRSGRYLLPEGKEGLPLEQVEELDDPLAVGGGGPCPPGAGQ